MFTKQCVVTLDLEGVLAPEIWIAVAEKTGIKDLRLTTRDIPDYDVLMKGRIAILDRENIKLSDIQNVIANLGLLEGARDFMDKLRDETQVIILSDTFQEFASKPKTSDISRRRAISCMPGLLCKRLKDNGLSSLPPILP